MQIPDIHKNKWRIGNHEMRDYFYPPLIARTLWSSFYCWITIYVFISNIIHVLHIHAIPENNNSIRESAKELCALRMAFAKLFVGVCEYIIVTIIACWLDT